MDEYTRSVSPKVLLPAQDLPYFQSLPLDGSIAALTLEQMNGVIHISDGVNAWPLAPTAEQPSIPHRILGLATFSHAGAPLLQQAREILLEVDGAGDYPVFCPGPDDAMSAEAFYSWLIALQASSCVVAAQRMTALYREMALLRTQYDTLQGSFHEVEQFFQKLFVHPYISFTNQPSASVLSVPKHVQPGGWVYQELPLPAHGLAGVALHVAKAAQSAQGTLGVQLVAHETAQILETWLVPYHALTPGWLPLLLPRALSGRPELSVQLRVTWQPDGTRSPSLSLGAEHPAPEACAVVCGASAQPRRGLALRMITALPGLPVPPMLGAIYPAPTPPTQGLALPKWVFESAQEVSPPMEKLGWPLVKNIPEELSLQVHPMEEHTTIVRVPLACPAGMCGIAMQAKTVSAQGPVIEYAIAALEPNEPFEPYFAGNAIAGPHFSGWQEVLPQIRTNIGIDFGTPSQVPRHIYIATRLAAGQTSAYAWARVEGLTLFPNGAARHAGARS